MLNRTIAFLAMTAAISTPALADWEFTAPPIRVERVGNLILYHASISQLSQNDQKQIIDESVQLLKNELSQTVGKVIGLKTLSNMMLSEKALDTITAEAQKSVMFADTRSMRGALPVAFMLYGGGGAGFGIFAHGSLSGDLGLVIFPEKIVEVNTVSGETKAYNKLDFAWVLVPHAHVGIGAGGGVSESVGAAAIFGKMTSAGDFHGVTVSGSGNVAFALGADVQGSIVHNLSTSQSFFVLTTEFDWGPEASASIDGEGGYVYSLKEAMSLVGKKLQAAGTVEVPNDDTTINGKAPKDDDADDKAAPAKKPVKGDSTD